MNRICQILLRPSYASNLATTARTVPVLTATRRWYSADAAAPPAALDKDTLEKLVRTNKVVVFMKGNPQAPRCGFSNAVVQIMRMHGVPYDAHDVLENEALRQGKWRPLYQPIWIYVCTYLNLYLHRSHIRRQGLHGLANHTAGVYQW